MKEHRTPETKCPKCNKRLNSAANVVGDRGPENGALTICAGCAAWLVFTDQLSLREITTAEIIKLSDEDLRLLSRVSIAISGAQKAMKAARN